MRLPLRTRRRLVKALTWPLALLIVGAVLSELAYHLAARDGVSAQIYGLAAGTGDIVRLIGGVWLIVAVTRLGLWLWTTRRTN